MIKTKTHNICHFVLGNTHFKPCLVQIRWTDVPYYYHFVHVYIGFCHRQHLVNFGSHQFPFQKSLENPTSKPL